jgi:hypothetical protein
MKTKVPWRGFPWTMAIWAVIGWVFLAASRNNFSLTVAIIVVSIDIVAILVRGFMIVGQHSYNVAQAIAIVTFAAIMILQAFTITYYGIGTAQNFSKCLTRLDAFYVALGTFSTAGTGNISPISEEGRAWITGQYAADIVLLVGLISFLLWRAGKST